MKREVGSVLLTMQTLQICPPFLRGIVNATFSLLTELRKPALMFIGTAQQLVGISIRPSLTHGLIRKERLPATLREHNGLRLFKVPRNRATLSHMRASVAFLTVTFSIQRTGMFL